MSYIPAFMGNELGRGSDKSSKNRFAVHGICHVPHPSSFKEVSVFFSGFMGYES